MLKYEQLLPLLGATSEGMKFHLSELLEEFDIDGDALIATLTDSGDVICGLLALCEGSMESKLSIAFSIMDKDDDGFLTKRDTWRLLRSFLCVVFIIQKRPKSFSDCRQILQDADESVVKITGRMFKGKVKISLSDLVEWYSQDGFNILDFELANLFDRIDSPSKRHFKGNFDFDLPQVSSSGASGAVIFSGHFSCGQRLILTSEDSNRMRNLLLLSGIFSLDAIEVTHLLHCLKSTAGLIHRHALNQFLITNMPMHTHDKSLMATNITSLIFDDDSDTAQLPFPIVAVGLTVLCGGSKSSKLNLGFHLFDIDMDGNLSESELRLFLQAYLRVLVNSSSQRHESVDNKKWVDEVCADVAEEVFETRSAVDFAGFGEFYNTGGFKTLGWIELIDMSKWTLVGNGGLLTKGPGDNTVDCAGTADEVEGVDEEDYAFVLSLRYDEKAVITKHISRQSAAKVYSVSVAAGFHNIPPGKIHEKLGEASEDGLVSLYGFKMAARQLLVEYGSGVVQSTEECMSYLEVLFLAADITEEGFADLNDLVCALVVLCQGSKSDKLSFCFNLLSDSKVGLSRRGLYHFFRSLYWSIWTLSLCDEIERSEEEESSVQQESLFMDNTILALCDNLLGENLVGGKRVCFDDVARWYAAIGFRAAPWLELLDINKWIFLAS